jgi:hypothetical protein
LFVTDDFDDLPEAAVPLMREFVEHVRVRREIEAHMAQLLVEFSRCGLLQESYDLTEIRIEPGLDTPTFFDAKGRRILVDPRIDALGRGGESAAAPSA